MKMIQKAAVMFLTVISCFAVLPSCNAQAVSKVNQLIREMVYTYSWFPESNQARVNKLLGDLKDMDEEAWEKWNEIMAFWSYTNNEMKTDSASLPEGLEDTDQLCIIILGFQLNPDGTMKEELIGRLETALACAQQYPNAWLLCTGGPTAKSSHTTEAAAMGAWLMENGIPEERILLEERSLTTTENAQYCCALLRNEHPEVTSIALVSSDYHIPWAAVLFQTQCILAEDPARVVANAALEVPEHSPFHLLNCQRGGILEIAGIPSWR